MDKALSCIDSLTLFYKVIPSNINIVGNTVKEIIRYIEKSYGKIIDEEIIFELRVVLNELIINAIVHGNKADSNKKIKITSGLIKEKSAFVAIADDGEGYDYNYVIKKSNELRNFICNDDVSESGRGIMIVRSLCEQVKFNKKGNVVTIIKKLTKD